MSQARYTPAENRRAVKKHYDDNTEEVLKSKVIKRILQGKIPQKRSLEKYEIDQGVLNEIRAEANLPPVTLHKYTPPTIQSEDSDTDTPPVIQVQDESDSESVPPARTPSPEPEPQAPRTPSPPPPVSATKVRVAKMFDGKLFFGFGFKTPGDKFYTIEYDDGDSEEMNSTEFRKHAALAKRKAKEAEKQEGELLGWFEEDLGQLPYDKVGLILVIRLGGGFNLYGSEGPSTQDFRVKWKTKLEDKEGKTKRT